MCLVIQILKNRQRHCVVKSPEFRLSLFAFFPILLRPIEILLKWRHSLLMRYNKLEAATTTKPRLQFLSAKRPAKLAAVMLNYYEDRWYGIAPLKPFLPFGRVLALPLGFRICTSNCCQWASSQCAFWIQGTRSSVSNEGPAIALPYIGITKMGLKAQRARLPKSAWDCVNSVRGRRRATLLMSKGITLFQYYKSSFHESAPRIVAAIKTFCSNLPKRKKGRALLPLCYGKMRMSRGFRPANNGFPRRKYRRQIWLRLDN